MPYVAPPRPASPSGPTRQRCLARLVGLGVLLSTLFAAWPAYAVAPASQGTAHLFYIAGGRRIPLEPRGDQVVVALAPGNSAANLRKLTAPNAPLAGLKRNRALGARLHIFDLPQAPTSSDALTTTRQRVEAQSGVAWTAPVYRVAKTDYELVASDEIVVALRPGVNAKDLFDGDRRFASSTALPGTSDQFVVTVAGKGGQPAIDLANQLHADPRVAWATPNFYQRFKPAFTPNDPLFAQQWHLNNSGQFSGTPDADADLAEAWDLVPGGSSEVVIAVIDDGIELTHPDLAPNVFVNQGEIAGNGLDDDGNGWVDDRNGWDFTSNGLAGDNNPGADNPNDAHATAVAGVAAAAGNDGRGVSGVAYRSRILPVRIFNGDVPTSDANIAAAIYYAAGRTRNGSGSWRAADLLNNSWGGGAPNDVTTAAFAWASQMGRQGKGVPAFVAAGNNGTPQLAYPALLAGELGGVIAVGASTNRDLRASYSQYGAELDFVAPSSGGSFGIVTTDRVGGNGYNTAGDYTDTPFSAFGGTSSATPLAAGVAALALARDPNLTAAQIRGLLRNTADLVGPASPSTTGFHPEYGYGRVNADQAVRGVGVAEIQLLDDRRNLVDGSGIIDFGSYFVGEAAPERVLRIRNQGTLTLTLSSATLPASSPFGIVRGFGDTLLAAGETTTISVRFLPTAVGRVTQTLLLSSNDADEGSFEIGLTGSGRPFSVAGHLVEDWDGDGSRDSNDPPLPGWTVYIDQNRNGQLDRPRSRIASGTLNLAIPDARPDGLTSTLNVSGVGGQVEDLDVRINLAHSYLRDLQLSLISPNGTVIALISRRGGNGDNLSDTILDDEAPLSVEAGSAPFSGRFRPEQPLAGLDGQSPNGLWRLHVADVAPEDLGRLLSWELEITSQSEPNRLTGQDGYYAFSDLAPGSYQLRRLVPSGWRAVGPPSGAYSFTLTNTTALLGGRNFTHQRLQTIYGHSFDDADADGNRDAGEAGVANHTIYLDGNQNGVLDMSSVNINSGILDLAIPDGDENGNSGSLTSTLQVGGLEGAISDVDVQVTIEHAFDGDLQLLLVSPAGTVITLTDRRGFDGSDYRGTIFDDEAALAIAAGSPPFRGPFRPEQPLAGLDGQSPNGTWRLRAIDVTAPDMGVLVSWELRLTASPDRQQLSDELGNFRLSDMPAGAQLIRQNLPAGRFLTRPMSAVYSLTLASGGVTTGIDFGTTTRSVSVTADVVDVSPDPRSYGIDSIGIRFSTPISGFDLADLTLARNGKPVALSGAVLNGSDASFTLSNLGGRTSLSGAYTLTVRAAGSEIRSSAGSLLSADALDRWTNLAPRADVVDVAPDPRTTSVVSIGIRFNEPVTGFDLGDLTLTRNSTPIMLTGAILTGSGSSYTLTNLSALTGPSGSYTLTVRASGTSIKDAAGNALAAAAADSWLKQ